MTSKTEAQNSGTLSRTRLQFEIYKGFIKPDGTFEKIRQAGLGFLREGKHEYKLKIFSKLNDRFLLKPVNLQSGIFSVFVRDEVPTRGGLTRIYTCEVGDAKVIGPLGLMEIRIDLTSEPLYMSIFPRERIFKSHTPKLGELRLIA